MDPRSLPIFPIVGTKPEWKGVVPSILHEPCLPVNLADPAILRALPDVIFEMFRAMYAATGVGLAAPQIGIRWQLAVVDTLYVNRPGGQRLILLNPEWKGLAEEETGIETCLSLPWYAGDVPRHVRVEVQNRTVTDKIEFLEFDGFLARVVQHELDHLRGQLYTDRLPAPASLRRLPGQMATERAGTALTELLVQDRVSERLAELEAM